MIILLRKHQLHLAQPQSSVRRWHHRSTLERHGERPRNSHNGSGFTLVELLTVIAILVILAGLTVPAASSLLRSQSFNQTLATLNGTLDQARQYAIAQNTYVWVAFAQTGNQLDVAVVASPDGTDTTTNWTGSPAAGSPSLIPIAKLQMLNLTTLVSPNGTGTSRTVVPATPPTSVGQPLNNLVSFTMNLPGQSSPTTFNYALQFTPSGEARVVDGVPVDFVEFAVQPEKGPGVVDARDGAAIQVNGLTGQARVYRQ